MKDKMKDENFTDKTFEQLNAIILITITGYKQIIAGDKKQKIKNVDR